MRAFTGAIIAISTAVLLACAGASVQGARRYVDDSTITRPPVVLVYPFALDANEVAIDTLGFRDASQAERSSEERRVQNQLVRATVASLNERGINAMRGSEVITIPLNAFLIKGQFVTIDEGSRFKRMVIGFGAGSERLTTQVQVYRSTEIGLRRVAAAEASAHGDRMPGMAVPVGAGAVAGRAATSVVISGGMNVVQEVTGGLDRAAANIAEEIAKRAEAFYKERGWL